MAWQLIYTSAPRLLEAGRTGFGTVARHRAVSGMLASSVERFSQFARLPGHDPRRIVHAHRILTVGSGTFHVMSCLQDAGSDYTGRTNHIAHHLIAEPREIRTLATAGLTPADVLLSMKWRTSWSEGPRYLDSAEEIDLASFAAKSSHAWSAVTGKPASAGILWSREALKGCYLITPSGISALELFHESLLAVPAQAWQSRFTTCLEPNDDVADFRWVALPSSSPLRGQVETSNRLVLDLTRPSSLPAPPELDAPATASEAPAPAAPPPPPPQVPAAAQESMPSPGAGHAPVATMGGWSPEIRQRSSKKNRSYIGLSLVIAAVLILAVSGGLLWQFKQQQEQNQTRDAYAKAIAKLWKEDGLLLDETKKFLLDQPVLADGQTLLESHRKFFHSMRQVLNHPVTSPPPLPTDNKDDLKNLSEQLEEWTALHKNPWAKLQTEKETATVSSLYEAFRKWENSRNAIWKKLTEFLDLKAAPLPADELLQPLKATAKAVLSREEPERETRTNWVKLFDLLKHPRSPMDPDVQRWLKLWADLDGATPRAAAEKNYADNTLPLWLREKAKRVKDKQDKANASLMAEQNKKDSADHAKVTQKPKAVIEDADVIPAKHDIHVLLLKSGDDPTSKVPGLKVAADMQLYVGGAWDAHPSPDGKSEPKDGELKKWSKLPLDNQAEIKFAPSYNVSTMINFSNEGSLLALPEEYRSAANGLRLVGRSKDGVHVLFDLRLIPFSSVVARPIFAKKIPATADNSSTATLRLPEGFIPRLHLLGLINPVFSLRLDGTAAEQKFYELKPTADSSFEVLSPRVQDKMGLSRVAIEKRIEELEKGIQEYTEALKKSENSNSPKSVKDADQQRYKKSIADKEIELQTLRPKLKNLEEQPTIHFDLMPGHYSLLVEVPKNKIELCKLNVTAAATTSTPKPSNP